MVHGITKGDLRVDHPWARATTMDRTAVYMTLANKGAADKLLSVETPIAATAEVHETIQEKGVAKMRPAGALEIPAKKSISLQPGGRHIMLAGLKRKLAEGDTFPMTLVFETMGKVEIQVVVTKGGMSHH
jgi:periplasmic copper chaperone A